jgi:transposase InsO family protein
MGTIGDAYDNAVIESFWARMQTELLDRRRWATRLELANAIFEYLEIFHNRQRRHSALGVIVREVVDATDRWQAAEGGVGAVHVVPVNPGLQGTLAGGV